jgi:hypothetical protein
MSTSKSSRFYKSVFLSISLCLLIFSTVFSQSSQCILNVKNDRAYFHDRNNINGKLSFTPRKAFLVLGDQVAINCQDKNENWIYVSYQNTKGTITRGFIKKTDLENVQSNNLSKKEILSTLVGEHYLESISGFAGPYSMAGTIVEGDFSMVGAVAANAPGIMRWNNSSTQKFAYSAEL